MYYADTFQREKSECQVWLKFPPTRVSFLDNQLQDKKPHLFKQDAKRENQEGQFVWRLTSTVLWLQI